MVKFYRLLNKFVFGLLLNFNYLIIMILYFEDFPASYILQNSAWQRSKGKDLSPYDFVEQITETFYWNEAIYSGL